MKFKLFIAVMMVACVAEAKGSYFYQQGTLLKMESAECGVDSKGAEGIGGMLASA